jgi:YHS domain-containing protein
MARDPVCGTFVVPSSALAVRGKSGTVYFCSDKCRQAFVSRG